MFQARRRLARNVFLGFSAFTLVGAGLSGLVFASKPMDMVLLQLVFYGAWSCLFGARTGGLLGAMMEEDRCSDLDMGVLSSMGSMIGAIAAGLVGTAVAGLGLMTVPWWAVCGAFVLFGGAHLLVGWVHPLRVERLPHIDKRGRVIGPDQRPVPLDQQALRMPDRVGVLLALASVILLGLTMAMALLMGSDLGHPVMMAPMMYGMFGTMIGGMLGGWLAGLLDEHEGHPDHDNPVMVSAMALMAGMMGGMPAGMIGSMMAIMGVNAIALTVAAGLLLAAVSWGWVAHGRYRIAAAADEAPAEVRAPESSVTSLGSAVVLVKGMTCDACRVKVGRKVGAVVGVQSVEVDLETGRVTVRWGEGFEGLEAVRGGIERLGYEVERA